MPTNSFTDLEVWKAGHQLVLEVYELAKSFPADERFSLTSQIKRAAASVTANIAEGYGRKNFKEKEQFYLIAAGSLFELKDQLLIARDVKYIKPLEFSSVAETANKCHALLNALLAKHRTLRNSKFKIRDSK